MIPKFLTRFVKIPKAIDTILNCVGLLGLMPLISANRNIHWQPVAKHNIAPASVGRYFDNIEISQYYHKEIADDNMILSKE